LPLPAYSFLAILAGKCTTAIFVTHGQEETFGTAERVGALKAGRLGRIDTPENLYQAQATARGPSPPLSTSSPSPR
jgi:ABC-type Fe3+/spermidine/putrescine transport system ATPase subunit